ncbi:G-protein coupled receptor 157-like [Clytia hemisphaerica]|uniref:G-protein coupled receptors family 2 profile 2 domain-containing protein n=1 Tax=Clytia hemisphaerica TaxID=252671 RepID=A0A7M5X636_9CNID
MDIPANHNTTTNDIFTDTANNAINTILLMSASLLSTLGTLVTITTYFFIKDIKTMSRHIIVCISVADLLTCLANLSGLLMSPTKHNTSPVGCQVQSFLGTTAILSSFLWTLMLAVYLHMIIVEERIDQAKRLIIPWSHVICWPVPLIINVVALTTGALGNDGDQTSAGWCWIKVTGAEHSTVVLWMLVDGKGLEILTYIVIVTLVIKMKLHLKIKIRNYSRTESPYGTFLTRKTMMVAKQADRKLIFIPIILIILRIWGTIRFFIYLFNTGCTKDRLWLCQGLLYLHTLGDNLQGAMNCILYCFFTPKVYNSIVQLLCNVCCRNTCCKCCTIGSRGGTYESFETYTDDDEEDRNLLT